LEAKIEEKGIKKLQKISCLKYIILFVVYVMYNHGSENTSDTMFS